MNTQAAESSSLITSHVDIIKVWNTIQGEGPFAGMRATFIRLAGCNIVCPGCDTQYTKGRHKVPATEVLQDFPNAQDLVVITGGEPFRQASLPVMVSALLEEGRTVQIETNGSLPLTLEWHRKLQIVISPKAPACGLRFLRGDWDMFSYKYIVKYGHIGEDGLPSRVLDRQTPCFRPPSGFPTERIYIQPMDENPIDNQKNMQTCVDLCLKYGYRLSVQLHKLAGLE